MITNSGTSPAATGTGAPSTASLAAASRRRWLAAAVLIVGALMDMIDLTIVNVALPTIRQDLHASATQLEWVVSGYMLAFAAALIIAGTPGRPVRPQAGVPGRGRPVRRGQPRRRAGPGAQRPDRLPRTPGTGRRGHGPAGAGHVPDHVRAEGARPGVRPVRGDARPRLRRRPGAGRRADRGQPVRLELAVGVLRQPAGRGDRPGGRAAVHPGEPGRRRPAARPAGRRAAGRFPGGHRLPAAGGPHARLAVVDLAAAGGRRGRPGRPVPSRVRPARPVRARAADPAAPVPRPRVRRRAGPPAVLLGRHPGLLPDPRAVAAVRRALLAAAGRRDRRGVQRRHVHPRAVRRAAGPALRPGRPGRRRRADGGRPGRRAARGRRHHHGGQPVADGPRPGRGRPGPGPAGHPAGQRGSRGRARRGGGRRVGAVQHRPAARRGGGRRGSRNGVLRLAAPGLVRDRVPPRGAVRDRRVRPVRAAVAAAPAAPR